MRLLMILAYLFLALLGGVGVMSIAFLAWWTESPMGVAVASQVGFLYVVAAVTIRDILDPALGEAEMTPNQLGTRGEAG